jgi:hypothetical protein
MIPATAVDRAAMHRVSGYTWKMVRNDLKCSGWGDFPEDEIRDAVFTAYPNLRDKDVCSSTCVSRNDS